MNKQQIIAIILVFSLAFFTVSCDKNNDLPQNYNPYQGFQGVTIEVMSNAPPVKVYAGDNFNVLVKLHNRGAYNVITNDSQNEAVFFDVTYDPYYLNMNGPYPGMVYLQGKSYNNRQGSYDTLEFLMKAKPLEGQRESPSSKIIFNICYPYKTLLTADVCIDSDPFNMDVRNKACTARTQTFTDQGAPIAVTSIEPRMSTKRDDSGRYLVSPSFTITIKNVGGGNVILRDDTEVQAQCEVQNTNRNNWGKARITARLFDTPLVCTTNNVSFIEGEAIINCGMDKTKNEGGFIPLQFLAQPDTLFITLDYIYIDSQTRNIEIVRLP